jgi:hypothetical protein
MDEAFLSDVLKSLKEPNAVLALAFYLLAAAMLAVTLYSTESRQ